MRSLPQVLHEAAQQDAFEIVFAAGEPPMIRTAAGSVACGGVFAEGDLFDALGQVLAPEQQAELVVGNVVEFHIDSGSTRWSLITEAGAQGIVVRGRCGSGAPEPGIGMSLDLPPLEHSEDSEPAPAMRASVLNRATRRTALDLAASRNEPEAAQASANPQPASPRGPPSWLESTGFAEQDDSPDAGVDFALRNADPSDAIALPDEQQDLGALLRTSGSGEGTLAEHLGSVGSGTLCLVRRPPGPELVRHQLESAVIIDDSTDERVFASALERDPDTCYYIGLEDPSVRLGWILRRLEEGARVFVETRAGTVEGARRVLLGLTPSPRADAWVAAARVCWLTSQDGGWVLKRY
jgi:hypothetical protein